jgi:hypothetical protein
LIPLVRRAIWSPFNWPTMRTAYSRSTAKRGCIMRFASSPDVVKMRSPEVLKSRRPTASHFAPRSAGSAAKTLVAAFRIVVRDDLAFGLVIDQHARQALVIGQRTILRPMRIRSSGITRVPMPATRRSP